MNKTYKLRWLKGAAVAVALMIAAPTVQAQEACGYIIYTATQGHYMAHSDDGTSQQDATAFNPATCLWNISSNRIRPCNADATNLGTYYLKPNNTSFTYSTGEGTAWTNTETNVTYYYNRYTYYLRYNTSWEMSNSTRNTGYRATVYAVTKNTNVENVPESYNGTLSGTTVFTAAGATATYTPSATHTAAYTITTATYTYSGGTLATTTTNTATSPSPIDLSDGWTLTWSLSDDTYATINSSGTLTVKSTLPTTFATTNVQLTATKGSVSITASLPVNIFASEDVLSELTNGGTTGVASSTVTLNDYEDHNWAYYSDPDCPIHSLNPANVKITYYGNGTGTVQTNNSDSPSTWGANATGVKVGIDANASSFVYYKTLERTNGRTATSIANANGRCAYTTIANPFSVRPTYDSDNTSKYRGFYAWRVKTLKNGTIHSASSGGTSYGVGSTINAETEIYFAPSSEYGMEVEFEALWARAYVSTSGVPNHNLGVERNFYVITASANSNITTSDTYPCTYTSIYPNGTTDGTNAATSVTVYKRGGFTAGADSKIEYIILYNYNDDRTINANGKNFAIGRGVSGYNGGLCATNLYGLNGDATTSFRFNFASGRFANLYFCGSEHSMSSGVLTSVIGCDYDRAMGDNSKLKITSDIIAGYNGTGGSNNNEGADFLRCTVKSGDFDLGNYGGGVQFYLSLWGNTGSGTYGKKTMVIEGGVFSDISGGIDVQDDQVAAADMVEIRMKGGTVNGALYGAAQYAAAYGNRYIIITGGTLKGWVAGGANGTRNDGGQLSGASYVYFGGDARLDSEGSTTPMNSASGGNIFGAGCGFANGAAAGEVTQGTTVVVADESYVERGVYGGGGFGYCNENQTSYIYILGGTVDGKVGGVTNDGYTGSGQNSAQTNKRYTTDITGGVYGGACQNKGGIVNIKMKGGQVNGGIYGGSNYTGTVTGPVTMQIDGGQVGTTNQNASVFGGGYGSPTIVTGNVSVTLGASTSAADSATVNGNVYGGSALGKVNGTSFDGNKQTTVTMNKALVNGNLFGGAYGNGAVVNGKITVTVNGGHVTGSVYGGGDAAAYTPGANALFPVVNMTGGKAGNVFGGGKGETAGVTGNPQVTLSGTATVEHDVYGGGNAAAVDGNTSVKLQN